MVGKQIDIIEYEGGALEVCHKDRLLPFKVLDQQLVKEYQPYEETSKTIDYRVDELLKHEQNRRAAWLDKRLRAAAKRLDIKEEVIQAAEEVISEQQEQETRPEKKKKLGFR